MDITTVAIYLKDLLATILTLVMMMSPAFGNAVTPYTAENSDELITSFAVVSDIHVETNNPTAYKNLKGVLEGIKAGSDIDAVVYTGDNVMNGQLLEDFFFYSAIKAVMPAKKNYVVAGNHDLGNGAGDYYQLRNNYIYNNNFYFGSGINRTYYYKVLNGCYMIVLCSEDPTTGDFTMSREQFDWLEGVLMQAKEAGAPIFIFNHFPLRYLDNDSEVQKEELGALLVNYGAELFVHGHIHDKIDANNFFNSYGVDCINLCRVTETVEYEAGDGIVVEVYEDEVLVRARNFITGEWLDGLEYRYPVTK